MKAAKLVLFCFALLVAVCPAFAQTRPAKKLIQYGWGVPDPVFVQQNIGQMEKMPFDGIIFQLPDPFNKTFDIKPWDEAALQPQLDALAGIKWGTFTDNFLCLYAANDAGMDWFNDQHWETIMANLRLEAKAAKAGGCVGICFDTEPYGANPWVYPNIHPERSFAEVQAAVRIRGAQFMSALQDGFPNVRILTFFTLSKLRQIMDIPDTAGRMDALLRRSYNLVPAFVNGMLDAAAPGVKIIDGNEKAYYYTSPLEYFIAYHMMKQRALSFIADENKQKYIAQVQAGTAIYMDQLLATRPPAGSILSYYLSPENRLFFLEHDVYYSLVASDEYAWCYSERMNWWKNEMPEGAEAAVRSARDKVAAGEPLGFDIAKMIAEGTEKMHAAGVSGD